MQEVVKQQKQGIWQLVLLGALNLAAAILPILAGIRMRSLRSYGLSVTGAIVAAIPCLSVASCPCFLGLIFGIWALIVLLQPRREECLPLTAGRHRGCPPAVDSAALRNAQSSRRPSIPHDRTMTQRLITVGHSPDPDDAFMFYALAHDKIDTGDLRFRHELQDIETLNRRALRGELEVTAVSIHAYAHLLDKYALLPSGCSMGDRYGPMVVARRPLTVEQLKTARIAVPGTLTTAFLTLRLLLPGGFAYEVMPFDQILAAVAEGRFDAGLIIHEGQLTFQNQGLQLVVDLGVWWQEKTGLPLPLGGNVVRRDLGADTIRQISRLLKESIRYALAHRDEALDYALQYARDMDKGLGGPVRRHVRQRLDARLRPARPGGGAAAAGRGAPGRHHPIGGQRRVRG